MILPQVSREKGVHFGCISSTSSFLNIWHIIFEIDKEDNLYELLELESPYVSNHQIDVGFDKAKKKYSPLDNPENQGRFDRIIAAQKCLKRTRCRD